MDGITKVIDELGMMILEKDMELERYQEEVDQLKRRIHVIEQCLELYEACYNHTENASNSKSTI